MIYLLICFLIFCIGDYFVVKYEIKKNIDLFYSIHQKTVIKALKKDDKI